MFRKFRKKVRKTIIFGIFVFFMTAFVPPHKYGWNERFHWISISKANTFKKIKDYPNITKNQIKLTERAKVLRTCCIFMHSIHGSILKYVFTVYVMTIYFCSIYFSMWITFLCRFLAWSFQLPSFSFLFPLPTTFSSTDSFSIFSIVLLITGSLFPFVNSKILETFLVTFSNFPVYERFTNWVSVFQRWAMWKFQIIFKEKKMCSEPWKDSPFLIVVQHWTFSFPQYRLQCTWIMWKKSLLNQNWTYKGSD